MKRRPLKTFSTLLEKMFPGEQHFRVSKKRKPDTMDSSSFLPEEFLARSREAAKYKEKRSTLAVSFFFLSLFFAAWRLGAKCFLERFTAGRMSERGRTTINIYTKSTYRIVVCFLSGRLRSQRRLK